MVAGAEDTVFALATGAGRSAIAVMRLSGAGCRAVLDALCGGRPPARVASLRRLRDCSGNVLDHALVLWFPGPASFTGEDSVELHLHGGAAVLRDVAAALVAHGLRPAEPGEFSRRAFLNGRMDLVAAEAVADLVEAETSAQRRQALRQLDGALGTLLREWATELTGLLARQEALIDFPDEDLPQGEDAGIVAGVANLAAAMREQLDDGRRGERLRQGLVFAVLGAPNAGKSTLVNALADRDVAIVSPQPGTTRDVLEARVVLGGVPVTLLDTAGLREGGGAIEAEGMRRARARAAEADVLVVLAAADAPQPADLPAHPALVRVWAKADLSTPADDAWQPVSALTGTGMAALVERLAEQARRLTQAEGPPPLTRARHRAALTAAVWHLDAALMAPAPELRGEDLRLALRALGRITGQVGVEEILDSVFRQFCIGK